MKVKEIYNTMEYGPAPESATEAFDWLKSHNSKLGLFIDGKWVAPASKKYFNSTNPSDNKQLAKIAEGNKKDIDKAVDAATKALPGWNEIGGHSRAKYLYAIARQIQKHARLFAVLESLSNVLCFTIRLKTRTLPTKNG